MSFSDEIRSSELPQDLVRWRDEISAHAKSYGLDFFDVIFEMVDYDQMNSMAAFTGFPVRYPHWRFGMEYDQLSKGYAWGLQKIYEMVINTNPSYAYLMKSNQMVDQKTVMAHVYGHVDFFKNNIWFSKTNRKMLDQMANHAVKIRDYMDRYGQDTVESFIDQCLAIENLIDPHSVYIDKPENSRKAREFDEPIDDEGGHHQTVVGKMKTDRSYMDKYINPPEFLAEQKIKIEEAARKSGKNPADSQKDVLAFLMHHAPLKEWEHEVLSIIRDESYYFAPQAMTKIMNEGWASYWHSTIMTQKVLKDSEVIDFADHHAGTMATSPGRINPYKVGIELLRHIEERWNKGRFGKEYNDCSDFTEKLKWDKKLGLGREKIFQVRKVCNDITFIDEYLTQEFVEEQKLYTYAFNRRSNQYEIVDRDYKSVKEKLLFGLTNRGQPYISVADGNFQNKGELLLLHKHMGLDLDVRWARETMKAMAGIWRRPVNVETQYDNQRKLLTMAVDGEYSERFL